MKQIAISSFLLVFALSTSAQISDPELLISKLTNDISALNSTDLDQTAEYSKADFCTLTVGFKYLDNPALQEEEVMYLNLRDMDEDEIDVEYNEDLDEWDLSVYCNNLEERVLITDKDEGNYYESILMVSDRNKETLEELKLLIRQAILTCKGY